MTYVVIDDILKGNGFSDDCYASGTAAKILTVGMMSRLRHVRGLSVSRFNRQLHALCDWLVSIVQVMSEFYRSENCIMGRMPCLFVSVPVSAGTKSER